MANCPWQWHRCNIPISVPRCLWQMPQTLLQQIVEYKAPRQPSRIHLEFHPWQLPRGSGIAASLQLQKVTLPIPRCPWPMPPTSLHCGRLPVAVASLQVSLCQAYRFLLRFHQKSIKNPWKIHPGGSLGVPRPPQRGPGAILSFPEGSQSGPGPFPRLPRAPRKSPQGPRGRPRDGP